MMTKTDTLLGWPRSFTCLHVFLQLVNQVGIFTVQFQLIRWNIQLHLHLRDWGRDHPQIGKPLCRPKKKLLYVYAKAKIKNVCGSGNPKFLGPTLTLFLCKMEINKIKKCFPDSKFPVKNCEWDIIHELFIIELQDHNQSPFYASLLVL